MSSQPGSLGSAGSSRRRGSSPRSPALEVPEPCASSARSSAGERTKVRVGRVRVLIVSAHYPPNFVSGGSLVPQRLARGLRQRGHEVYVYAGWFGSGRSPLQTWNEADDSGLPVRWVVTTPWTDWADVRNYDNPEVAADFATFLADVRPDIVHAHSLQGLGAGLLSVARSQGAPVVLTMHDFWWFCGRQFLVGCDLVPCCLVVDAGICPCQVDRPWLEARTEFLRRQLDSANVVLAPSAIAADVLAANGVEPGRLHIDENGLANLGGHGKDVTASGGHGETVRFLYSGGPDPLKGAHVLLAAAHTLAGRSGWWLQAYGVAPSADDADLELERLPVELLPAFHPSALDAVLAQADVLIIPSLMRESHSIATREALVRGLAVICTDCLGPEEVVAHEVNGLVVSSGNARLLAAAMARLIDDRKFLDQLRSHPPASPIRDLYDQLDGLETTYSSLLDHPPQSTSETRLEGLSTIQRVLFVSGIGDAPLRYRARLPAEALALLGVSSEVRHYRDPDLEELAAKADAVVLYRVPATTQILRLVDAIHKKRIPVLFDVDDLIFDPDIAGEIPALQLLPPDEAELWMQGVRRYRTTLEACDTFIGSTPALCRHAADITGLPTEHFHNGIGVLLGRLSDAQCRRPRAPGPLRIGYLSGTITHDLDWRYIEPAVIRVLERHSEVELWLGGLITPS
ncbi:MAG: glycosyltransferase, partial [Actinomycetota bacterium]|nr:glycosyltransferase [Actinomycetota bacterium]